MKYFNKIGIATFFLMMLFHSHSFSQETFFATQSGDWNLGTTWGISGCTSGCTAGVDYPGPGDFAAVPSGIQVTLNGNYSVGFLILQYDSPSAIKRSGFQNRLLTINGYIAGYDFDVDDFQPPTTTVIENHNNLDLIFTGTGLDTPTDPVISFWSHAATLKQVNFNPPSSATTLYTEGFTVNSANVVVENGNLLLESGEEIHDFTGSSTLTINAGASLDLEGTISGDGTPTSLFGTINISGNVTVGVNSYLNTENFSLAGGSDFSIEFNGANQTEGWWYDTSSPTTVDINVASTVNYTASAPQAVAAVTYGNLGLRSPVSASVKTLQSTNSLSVEGDLLINSANVTFNTSTNSSQMNIGGDVINNGTWSPTQLVIFNGTSAQIITGNYSIVFEGGIRISNIMADVSLFNQGMVVNGTFDIDPAGSFNPDIEVVNLSGNLINDGTLQAGTNTAEFIFDGTTAITGSGSHNFNNITISNTVTSPSATLNVDGDFVNNGTFTNVTGTVVFTGSIGPQSISGSSPANFNNILAQNDISSETLQWLNGGLTLESGVNFDVAGVDESNTLVLVSTASNTAYIAAIPAGASISGNVLFQRYVSASEDVYRQIGVPITGITATQLSDDFSLTTSYNKPAVYSYNETVTGNLDNGFESVGSGATLVPGLGYTAYIDNAGPVTVDIYGPVKQGGQTFSLSYTDTGSSNDDGWNFLANPYPAPIDFDDTGWVKGGGIINTAYVWDATTGSYLSYNAGTSTGGLTDGIIAPGQSFWVQTNGTDVTLQSTEAVKVNTKTTSFHRTENEVSDHLTVSLDDGSFKDQTFIVFHENATDGFDNQYDGRKLWNKSFNLTTVTPDGDYMVINTTALNQCGKTYQLAIYNTEVGNYDLAFNDFDNLLSNYPAIVLHDKFLDKQIDITQNSTYNFDITDDAATYGEERFEIEFLGQAGIPELNLDDNKLRLSGLNSYDSVEWYKDNNLIFSSKEDNIIIADEGEYYATIYFTGGCTSTTSKFNYRVTGVNSAIQKQLSVYPNPATDVLNMFYDNTHDKVESLSVMDLRGVILYDNDNVSNNKISIDLRHFAKGMYILTIRTESGLITKYFNKL